MNFKSFIIKLSHLLFGFAYLVNKFNYKIIKWIQINPTIAYILNWSKKKFLSIHCSNNLIFSLRFYYTKN